MKYFLIKKYVRVICIVLILFDIMGCKNQKETINLEKNSEINLQENYSLKKKFSKASSKSNKSTKDFYIEYKFIQDFEKTILNSKLYNIDISLLSEFKKYQDSWTNEIKYQTLIELVKKLPMPYALDIDSEYKINYDRLLDYCKRLNRRTSKRVPKLIHFIWLGGKLGNIQKEYITLWAKLNPDHNIKIWYDSDHLNNYDVNKKMREYLSNFLIDKKNQENYQSLYSEELIKLQNKMNEYIYEKSNEIPKISLNEIRENFLNEFLVHKNSRRNSSAMILLNDFTTSTLDLVTKNPNVEVSNIADEKIDWRLKDAYHQELNLRGNFAAASDSVRLEILSKYGGMYLDVDVLPPIKIMNELLEIDSKAVRNFFNSHFKQISYAYYEELFNQNLDLLPSRKFSDVNKVKLFKLIDSIQAYGMQDFKLKMTEHFLYFKENKNLSEILNSIDSTYTRPQEIKTSFKNNNVIITHEKESNSDVINLLIEKIKKNYKELNKFEINNPKFRYPYNHDISDVFNKKTKEFNHNYDLSIFKYRYDSITPDATVTVHVSGPMVYENLFKELNIKHESLNFLTHYDDYNNLYNRHTEEDKKSSWILENFEEQPNENIILKIGYDNNTLKAIKYYENKFKINNEKYSVISYIENKRIDISNKVNLHIIGNANITNGALFINHFSSRQISTKLIDLFSLNNKIEYINILSCNPNNNPNETVEIENFAKVLLEELNRSNIETKMVIVRNDLLKITTTGEELFPQGFGLYYKNNIDNRLFIIRNNLGEYITLSRGILNLNKNKTHFEKLRNFNGIIHDIFSKKTKHLADFNYLIDDYNYEMKKLEVEDPHKIVNELHKKGVDTSQQNLTQLESDQKNFNKILTEDEFYDFYKNLNEITISKDDFAFEDFDRAILSLKQLEILLNKYHNLTTNSFIQLAKSLFEKETQLRKDKILLEANRSSKLFEESLNKMNFNENEKPVLHSLDILNKKITVYNNKRQNIYNKYLSHMNETDLNNLNKFKDLLDSQSKLFYRDMVSGDPHFNISRPSLSLSHAYLIKNIIDYFSKNNNDNNSLNSNSVLDEIVKVHIYTNLTQLSLDVIESGAKVAQVIQLLKSSEFKNINSLQTFSKISSVLGTGLNILNVAFDATELYLAKTTAETAKYGTQLALDGASLGFMTGGLLLGESAGGVFLSGIGEVFGGLAVGISSYSEIVGRNIDDTKKFANYFRDYEKDHGIIVNAENYFPDTNNTVLTLAHKDFKKINNELQRNSLNVVIEEIDLTTQNKYKIVFGDHVTYPISRHENGKYFYHAFNPNPTLIRDTGERVKLREALGIPKEKTFNFNKIQRIILPNQIQNLIEYSFMSTPFNISRNDSEFSSVDKIQNNAKFIFRYTFMHGLGDRSVGGLNFIHHNTDIKIKLNSNNQNIYFLTPEIPDYARNKLNYIFNVENTNQNEKNSFHIYTGEGAKYKINPMETDDWHIHINSKFESAKFVGNEFVIFHKENSFIKKYSLIFNEKKPARIYIHDATGITYLSYNGLLLSEKTPVFINSELNADNFNGINEIKGLLNRYHNYFENILSSNNESIRITNFKRDLNSNKETIFYNNKNDSIVYSGINVTDLEIYGKVKNGYIFTNKGKNKIYYNSTELFEGTEKEIIERENHLFIEMKNDKVNLSYYFDLNSDLNLDIYCKIEISQCLNDNLILTRSNNHFNLSPVIRLLKADNQKTDKFFMIKNNQFFCENDEDAKKIQSYKDLETGHSYHFISGLKFYIIIESSTGELTFKQFDLNGLKREYLSKDQFVFSNEEYIFEFNYDLEYQIIGLKSEFLSKNINKNLKDVIASVDTESKIISILLNETDFAEYDKEKNLVYIHEKNRLAIGESLKYNDRYYFYQTDSHKYFYTDFRYINPANFKIVRNSNLYKLEYNHVLNWTEDDINKNEILIKNIDTNKKIALYLQHFNNERWNSIKIKDESCTKLLDARNSLKKTLCKIGENININKKNLINAYSEINSLTLFLTNDQGSFRQLNSSTNLFAYESTVDEYWGVYSWISSSNPYQLNYKLFAFGEITNGNHFLGDIRFIDYKGNILKLDNIENSIERKYVIEKTWSEKYLSLIFAVFVVQDNRNKFLYILKKDGTYDILNTTQYSLLKTGFIFDLFPNISSNEIKNIDYIVKLKKDIILYKKSTKTGVYEGYYIYPISNLIQKNSSLKVDYVKIN